MKISPTDVTEQCCSEEKETRTWRSRSLHDQQDDVKGDTRTFRLGMTATVTATVTATATATWSELGNTDMKAQALSPPQASQ